MIEKKETFSTLLSLIQETLDTPASSLEAIGLTILIAFFFLMLLMFLTFVLVKFRGEEEYVPVKKKKSF